MDIGSTLVVDDVAPKPSAARLAERLEQIEEDREDSSRRLHIEIDDLKRRIEAMTLLQNASEVRMTRIDSTPLDAEKIRFAPRVVVAIVAACVSIVLGMYAVNYGIRSDVRDILTRQEQRDRLEEVNRKLTDQQTEAITKAVDVIDKRQQLQAIQIGELKEMVLKQGIGK
jgi:hypothetical protein